jgi:hypothetical protein
MKYNHALIACGAIFLGLIASAANGISEAIYITGFLYTALELARLNPPKEKNTNG